MQNYKKIIDMIMKAHFDETGKTMRDEEAEKIAWDLRQLAEFVFEAYQNDLAKGKIKKNK